MLDVSLQSGGGVGGGQELRHLLRGQGGGSAFGLLLHPV